MWNGAKLETGLVVKSDPVDEIGTGFIVAGDCHLTAVIAQAANDLVQCPYLGIETNTGIHAGNDRNSDGIRDQRQCHDVAGKDVGPDTRTACEPFATVGLKSVYHWNFTKARRAQMRVK